MDFRTHRLSGIVCFSLMTGWLPTCVQQAAAQDLPPDLTAIAHGKQFKPSSPSTASYDPVQATVSDHCGMLPFDMTLSRTNGEKHRFSVLAEQPKQAVRNVFAATQGLASDADGSPRAYHPLDPAGKGQCKIIADPKGNNVVSGGGICALDTLPDGEVHAFVKAQEVTPFSLGDDWTKFWGLVSSGKLTSFDLHDATGIDFGDHYYLFYWKEKNLTVSFKDENIQRTSAGYPCVRGTKSVFPGYFISGTTLKSQGDVAGAETAAANDIAPPECLALRNIDAEAVPFFVIPGGSLNGAQVGDVVVARLRNGPKNGLVFGIAADEGPINKFGEGSVLFNQLLFRGPKAKPVINNAGLDDIDEKTPIAILILGGTKPQLNGDYTRANVEKVAKAAFVQWGMEKNLDPADRFDACVPAAKINSRE